MKITTNEGRADRITRVTIGLLILGTGLAAGSWWGALGLIPIVTGVVGYCPAYSLFGFNTCPLRSGTKR